MNQSAFHPASSRIKNRNIKIHHYIKNQTKKTSQRSRDVYSIRSVTMSPENTLTRCVKEGAKFLLPFCKTYYLPLISTLNLKSIKISIFTYQAFSFRRIDPFDLLPS